MAGEATNSMVRSCRRCNGQRLKTTTVVLVCTPPLDMMQRHADRQTDRHRHRLTYVRCMSNRCQSRNDVVIAIMFT